MYLIEGQAGGTWDEPEYTGTGFPGYGVGQTIKLQDPELSKRLMQGPELSRAFMLRYGLYRHYFPLMALGRALRRRPAQAGGTQAEPDYAGHGAGQTIKPQDPELSKRLMQGPELSRAFMLRWDLYRQYFPLMALGRALRRRPGAALTLCDGSYGRALRGRPLRGEGCRQERLLHEPATAAVAQSWPSATKRASRACIATSPYPLADTDREGTLRQRTSFDNGARIVRNAG